MSQTCDLIQGCWDLFTSDDIVICDMQQSLIISVCNCGIHSISFIIFLDNMQSGQKNVPRLIIMMVIHYHVTKSKFEKKLIRIKLSCFQSIVLLLERFCVVKGEYDLFLKSEIHIRYIDSFSFFFIIIGCHLSFYFSK